MGGDARAVVVYPVPGHVIRHLYHHEVSRTKVFGPLSFPLFCDWLGEDARGSKDLFRALDLDAHRKRRELNCAVDRQHIFVRRSFIKPDAKLGANVLEVSDAVAALRAFGDNVDPVCTVLLMELPKAMNKFAHATGGEGTDSVSSVSLASMTIVGQLQHLDIAD